MNQKKFFNSKFKKISLFLVLFLAGILSLSFTKAQSIGDVDLIFCNPLDESGVVKSMSKNLQLQLDDGQEGNICMQIFNKSSKDIHLQLGFVDGTISNDFDQKKVCKNEGENQNFGKFVNINSSSVVVPADGSVIKNAKINFPKGYGGMVNGCVTYYIRTNDQLEQGNSSFDILVRKASFVDVLVNGEFQLGIQLNDFEKNNKFNRKFFETFKNPKINLLEDVLTKDLSLQIEIENIGSISQNLEIVGTISNFFGYQQVFESSNRKILGQNELLVSNVIKDLPFYKGPFYVKYQISYTPDFEFETNKISSDMKETKVLLEEGSFFVIPWLIIVILLLIILAIVLLVSLRIRYHKKRANQKSFYLNYNTKMPVKKTVKKAAPKKAVKKVATKKVVKKAAPKKAVKKVATKKVVKKAAPKKAVKKVTKKK